MPNSLIHQTSLYLLQHANNPVNWYPWGNEALELAKKENKPILVSIGYAACHWCHVMEHESFENEATAALMNAHFINIKIDREERPDIDQIYMDAVQAMTGSGGWPLNVFLTPELKPFYGGTYFPPTQAYNRASWNDVLQSIHNAWITRSNELIAQGDEMLAHLQKTNNFLQFKQEENVATAENLILINSNLLKNADTLHGGFGNAPKFPQFGIINYLLQHFYFFGNENALKQGNLSLQKMIHGGIYDQLAGGLARYSTDAVWLAPHFEKMLYDNALFIQTLSKAFLITQNQFYLETIQETIHFLQTDMQSEEHLFYAALDADSEGVEGKYYCWTLPEITDALNEKEAAIFCEFYDVTAIGNFTEPHHNITTNILHKNLSVKEFAVNKMMDEVTINTLLNSAKNKLITLRKKRIPPSTDDKCILGWNALMNKALVNAYQASLNTEYLEMAEQNMNAMLHHFLVWKNDTELENVLHTFKNGKAIIDAFLDDLAYLADALLSIYQVTFYEKYKATLLALINYLEMQFADLESTFYFYTKQNQPDIILRKKEVFDNATPSGNAIMANVLMDASILLINPIWHTKAENMVQNIAKGMLKFPSSFALWGMALQKIFFGINEISCNNSSKNQLTQNKQFIPNTVIKTVKMEEFDGFMLCNKFTCQKPVLQFSNLYIQIKELELQCLH
jgi:uncharacterized protein